MLLIRFRSMLSAVPPLMMKTASNPGGLPKDVSHPPKGSWQARTADHRRSQHSPGDPRDGKLTAKSSKLWLSSRATNRGRGKCGRWVLKE
jgi:hypothetical protein